MRTRQIKKSLSFSNIENYLGEFNEEPIQVVIPKNVAMGGIVGLDARLIQYLITVFIDQPLSELRVYIDSNVRNDNTAISMMEKALWIGAVWVAQSIYEWRTSGDGKSDPISRNDLLYLAKSTMEGMDKIYPNVKGRQLEAVLLEGSRSKNYLSAYYSTPMRHKQALKEGGIDGSLRSRSEFAKLLRHVMGKELQKRLSASLIDAVAHCLRELIENADIHGMTTAQSDPIERGVRYVTIKVKYLKTDKIADIFGGDAFLESYGKEICKGQSETTQILEISVVDSGLGIPASLRPKFESEGQVLTDAGLIEKSLERGVTSQKGNTTRHGYGLFHLNRHLERNNGLASIRSGSGRFDIRYLDEGVELNHQDHLSTVRGTAVTLIVPVSTGGIHDSWM